MQTLRLFLPPIIISSILLFLAVPLYAAYTPTTADNICAAGAVAVITTKGLECKLAGDILAQGVTVNSGTLTACSDDELLWTDNGKITAERHRQHPPIGESPRLLLHFRQTAERKHHTAHVAASLPEGGRQDILAGMNRRGFDIASMTAQERLSLPDALRDGLAATSEASLLTEAQCAELDRRLDDLEVEGPVGIPWDEVLSRISSRRR